MVAKATRRRFFGLMAAAPAAAKTAADNAAMQLAGVGSGGIGPPPFQGLSSALENQPSSNGIDPVKSRLRVEFMRALMANRRYREEAESLAYAQCRHVSYLDHDLASKRSFSLAAKITFQRQRNVEREIEAVLFEDSPWLRMQRWAERVTKMMG